MADIDQQALLEALGGLGVSTPQQPAVSPYGVDPDFKKRLKETIERQISGQNHAADTQLQMIKSQLENSTPQADLSPAMGYLNSISKHPVDLNSYQKPEDPGLESQRAQDQFRGYLGTKDKISDNEASLLKLGLTPNTSQQRAGLARERMDEIAHRNVVQNIIKDKPLNDRLNQYNNLSNALTTFSHSDITNPNSLAELQQAIRGNMGIKGSSGVGEREETYFKSLGLNGAKFKQFLTGNPEDLKKDPKFSELIKHLQNLATIEQKNIQSLADRRLMAVAGGHASIYKRRPDLRSDLESLKTGYQGQFSGDDQNQVQAGVPVSSGAANANASESGPHGAVVQQNGQTYKWNPKTKAYE